MGHSRIWETLQPVIPQNAAPQVENCIRSVDALPGLNSWVPKPNLFEVLRVLAWGLAVRATAGIPSFDSLRAKIGAAIEANGEPARADLAELSGGALLTNFAQKVESLPATSRARTPDLRTAWDNNFVV